jgi:outer membrane protein OmpA-like peptidoglycan-associated protein
VGGIVQYRMPQTSGADLIISSGVLYQPGIGGVASFVIPVQLGLSMPMGSPAPPPRNAAPAVVIPSGPPPVAVTPAPPLAPIKAEIVVGSDIFVFEVESDELRGGAQKFTKELAQILIANAPSWKEVEVVGYSSPLEPDEVAQRRSEKVRQALIAAGIPIGQIKVTANKNKSYSQVVKGAPQRVDVIIASSEGTEVSKLKTVVGPLQEKWANLSYRFRHQALGFELGHDYLTKPAQKMIIKIAQILKDKSSEWSQLVIYGYTDALGIKSANVKLAKKRAANVLNIFAKQGLDPNKMEAIGMTAESPAKSENPEEKEEVSLESNPEDRRVEIEIMGIKNREELDRLMETLSEN